MASAPDQMVRSLLGFRPAQVILVGAAAAIVTALAAATVITRTLGVLPIDEAAVTFLFGTLVTALLLSILWAVELRSQNRKKLHTERSLEQSERNLRTLIDAIPVIIAFIDADGRIRTSNRAHADWFGISPGEIIGASVHDLLEGQFYESSRKQIEAALSGQHVRFEGPLRNRKGDVRYVERNYIPSRCENGDIEGYFVCVNDVTDRKSREEALLRTKRETAEIVESLQEGFAVFDEDDRLVMANQNYARIFPTVTDLIKPGVKFEELIRAAAERGQNVDALESKEVWIQRRLEAHARARGRFEHRFTDGRWVWVEERKTSDGRTLSSYIDITQLKQRETELRNARDQAQVADAAKSEFLANVSHELRTPLNAIMGFSEVMANEMLGPISEQYGDYARDINASGKHLLNLVNSLLDISKVEAGKLELKETDVDIAAIAEDCNRLVRPQADENGIVLSTHIAADVTPLRADEMRLKQIMLNLLSNAVKFTPDGGHVRLDVVRSNDGDVSLTVADDGIGMDEGEIALALEPFGQSAEAYSRDHQGTGLGLPLAKSLVELHGGHIAIESTKGAGTRTTVTLPKERLRPDQNSVM